MDSLLPRLANTQPNITLHTLMHTRRNEVLGSITPIRILGSSLFFNRKIMLESS